MQKLLYSLNNRLDMMLMRTTAGINRPTRESIEEDDTAAADQKRTSWLNEYATKACNTLNAAYLDRSTSVNIGLKSVTEGNKICITMICDTAECEIAQASIEAPDLITMECSKDVNPDDGEQTKLIWNVSNETIKKRKENTPGNAVEYSEGEPNSKLYEFLAKIVLKRRKQQ